MDKSGKAFSYILEPDDDVHYYIPKDLISSTETILREYGDISNPKEGIVYWGGTIKNNDVKIDMLYAPKAKALYAGVFTLPKDNADFVRALIDNNKVHVGIVHSHPTSFIDHSTGDDEMIPFKAGGLISIVVPDHCRKGMLPLTECGVHRFIKGRFERLTDRYIREHFVLQDRIETLVIDHRKRTNEIE
ncbi:MAG: hypothetical protein ACTSRU_11175 [Candidatus Hodarchaeales archaeon]